MNAHSDAESEVRAIKVTVELYTKLMSMGLPAMEYEGEIRRLGDKVRVRSPYRGFIVADQLAVARIENSNDDIVRLFVSRITEVCDCNTKYFVAKVFMQFEYALCIFGFRFESSLSIEERVAALEAEVAEIVTGIKRAK